MGSAAAKCCSNACGRRVQPPQVGNFKEAASTIPRSPSQEAEYYKGYGSEYHRGGDAYAGYTPLQSQAYHSGGKEKCCVCFCGCFCVSVIAFIAFWLIWPLTLGDVTNTWVSYLVQAPPQVINASTVLLYRADALAKSIKDENVTVPPALDLVCSGGGMLSMYFLGVHQVLSSLEQLNKTRIYRMGGASGGADVAFRLALLNDRARTMEQNLALGEVQEALPAAFSNPILAALTNDHLWRALGHWMLKNETNLTRLSGRVYTSITVLAPWQINELVSSYTSSDQAYKAFISTGSSFLHPDAIEKLEGDYDGKLALDGGATDCEPHFKDGLRSQLIVTVTHAMGTMSNQMNLIFGKYTLAEATAVIQKGQDDITSFLRSGGLQTSSLQVADERADWTAFDCDGKAVSPTMAKLHQAGFGVFLVFLLICALCCCRQCFRRCCDVRSDYRK